MRKGRTIRVALVLGLLFTGVSIADAIGEPAFLGVQLREETERPEGGALVTRVVSGSPADEAGLREGDIVVKFEGTVIRGPLALTQRIHTKSPGETVALTVVRDGEEETLEVELGRRAGLARPGVPVPPLVDIRPDPPPMVPAPQIELDEFPDFDPQDYLERLEVPELLDQYRYFLDPDPWGRKPRLGVQLVETTPELREHLGAGREAGVLVSKILSGLPAQRAGLQVGDLIVAVDGEPVATSKDLIRALADKVGETFDVEVIRDHRPRTIEVTIPEPDTDRPTGPRA